MYTIVPFNTRRAMSRSGMTPLFGDRFFRSFFDMDEMMRGTAFRVDVREEGDSYHMEAELPGVRQEDITLTVENDVLTIAADMNAEKHGEQENWLYSERRTGHMERAFSLEGIDQEGIKASCRDGVLHIELPKQATAPERSARRIEIRK